MNGEVVVVDDVAAAFADLVVREQPRSIALSGGGTARRCYETLVTRSGLDWSTVTALFGDERWVPIDHPDSNEGMVRVELLDHVVASAVISMRGAGDTPEEAADTYDEIVRDLRRIDVVHLGVGPDGHTASLFPGSPALDVTDRFVITAEAGMEPWHRRITMTLAAIATGRLVVVTVESAGKADAWRRIVSGDDVPAGRIDGERVVWLVDPGVAGAAS
jgi:6-phosphogluconolactonase